MTKKRPSPVIPERASLVMHPDCSRTFPSAWPKRRRDPPHTPPHYIHCGRCFHFSRSDAAHPHEALHRHRDGYRMHLYYAGSARGTQHGTPAFAVVAAPNARGIRPSSAPYTLANTSVRGTVCSIVSTRYDSVLL